MFLCSFVNDAVTPSLTYFYFSTIVNVALFIMYG